MTHSLAGPGTLSVAAPPAARRRGYWVLDPLQDTLFVILAPVLVIALAVLAFRTLGAPAATALVLGTHIVMTVAHHLPTFIRVYGDLELFARHRWTFLLAPLLPFSISMAAGAWLIAHRLPVENLLVLFLLAVVWDPWHFLMQHYGFMRLYDRASRAPRHLAAGMDLALCATCFVAIMLASGDWLAGLLEDLQRSVGLPLALLLPQPLLDALQGLAAIAALAMLAVYAGYLAWCRRRGYAPGLRKLALFAGSFGAMALAYTPNAWIAQLAPGWSFKVGFAAIGIVHMTQYLAIVWRYNRGLSVQAGRARAGWFRRLHARGGLLLGGGYVLLCLLYGQTLTRQWNLDGAMVLLISLGLTSTLMHYYFDGFIWKLRQPCTAQALDLPPAPDATLATAATDGGGPGRVLLRQALYFGLPLALLGAGALAVSRAGDAGGHVGHLLRAHVLSMQGDGVGAAREAQAAYAAMQRQLPFERRMTRMHPTAARETSLALLVYNQSRFEHLVLPAMRGQAPDSAALRAHRAHVAEAVDLLDRALTRGQPIGHAGREDMKADDARRLLGSWRSELIADGS